MTTIHAWFSAEWALRRGSSVYRKPDGSTVNVTRTGAEGEAKGSPHQGENYVGEVCRGEDGGRVRANRSADSIWGTQARRAGSLGGAPGA